MCPGPKPFCIAGFLAAFFILTSCGKDPLATPSQPSQAPPIPNLALTLIATGLSFPLGFQVPDDGSGRYFVVEQPGMIKIIVNGSLLPGNFLDLRSKVDFDGFEMGLLGMAFHPNFSQNSRFYVNYNRSLAGGQLQTVIAEYQVSASDPDLADPASERILLTVDQPFPNHKAGQLEFGPDGFLYIGLGDGGSGDDPDHRAQNPQELLGKMLRIDVNAGLTPYGIPAGNPYAANPLCGAGGTGIAPCAEIYAWGLRNPWRYSFDRNGALWIADVGQDSWEEIDRLTAPANLGWRCREGAHAYNASCGAGTGLTEPVAEYGHNPDEAITGGYVYRGSRYPTIAGEYVFGDFISGHLFHISGATSAGSTLEVTAGFGTGISPSAFGEDVNGEIYVVDYTGGGLYALTVTP